MIPSSINLRGMIPLVGGVLFLLHSYGLFCKGDPSRDSSPMQSKVGKIPIRTITAFLILFGAAELMGLTGRRPDREHDRLWATHAVSDGVVSVSFPSPPVRHEQSESSPTGPQKIEILDCETPNYYLSISSTSLPLSQPGFVPMSAVQSTLASMAEMNVSQFQGKRIDPDSVTSIDGCPAVTTRMKGTIKVPGTVIVTVFFADPLLCSAASFVPDSAPSGTESIAERFQQSVSVHLQHSDRMKSEQPASAEALQSAAER